LINENQEFQNKSIEGVLKNGQSNCNYCRYRIGAGINRLCNIRTGFWGEGYGRLINIISRASGAPVICEALRYSATCAQNNIVEITKNEFAELNKAGLKDVLSKLTQVSEKKETKSEEVVAPPKKVVTYSIPGIDILELEDAVIELWRKGVYSESGMGCTGPIVLVSDDEADKAKEILTATGFMS